MKRRKQPTRRNKTFTPNTPTGRTHKTPRMQAAISHSTLKEVGISNLHAILVFFLEAHSGMASTVPVLGLARTAIDVTSTK